MTWLDFVLLALAGGCFGAFISIAVIGCTEWFENRREWKSNVRLRIRAIANGALCAASGTMAVLLIQVVLFRTFMKEQSVVAQTHLLSGSLTWIALAAFLGAATVLVALGCWSGKLLFRQPPVNEEHDVLSRIRRRFVITYAIAGLLGMVTVVCGATIISA